MVTRKREKNFSRLGQRGTVNRLKANGIVNDDGNGSFDRLTDGAKAELKVLFTQHSQHMTRRQLGNRLGQSFKDDARDTYKTLGYPEELTFNHYWAYYTREHIAKRVVDAPADACWQKPPEIVESKTEEGEDTEFEKAFKDLVDKRKFWHYLARIDRLSGIGSYGVLLLGFEGGSEESLEEEVTKKSQLLFIRPYKEDNASIVTFEEDITNERYGQPKVYSLKITNSDGGETETRVHWSRIVHVADDLMEDDILGTPRMMNVYNLLAGLHLVSGGSGEMFWRGAFPGLAFILDKDAEIDPNQGTSGLETEINDYIHDLNRSLRLQGMTVQNLAPQVADPSKHVEVLITLIAGARSIPKRILIGAERGELGGDRDENAWNKKVKERQTNYCDPMMIRVVVDRLILLSVLPTPKDGYNVEWEDITAPSEEEITKNAKTKSETLAVYGNSLGAQEVVPADIFLKEIMNFDDELIGRVNETLTTQLEDDLVDEEKEAEMRAEIEGAVMKRGIDKIAADEKAAKIAGDLK